MSAPSTRQAAGGDELTNLALAGLVGLVLLAAALRVAGNVAAFVTSAAQPTGGIVSGLGVLAHAAAPGVALGDAGLSPVAYWAAVALVAGAPLTGAFFLWRAIRRHGQRARADPETIPGTANADEVREAGSEAALLKRAKILRPSLAEPKAADVGYQLGVARGQRVWASVEDSILVLGPPRQGKGTYLVINAILDAPGAVITTSTRTDNLTATIRAREDHGPVAVFDPQRLAEGIPAGLRWSPIRGCETPLTAMIRAAGLAAGTGVGGHGVTNGEFWEGKTKVALQSMLHAAAIDGRTPAELFRWTLDPTAAHEAVAILQQNPRAAYGWADALDAMIQSDPRTRDSIWQGVSLSLAALADPRVLAAVSPADGKQFDPEKFLREKGTLYLLATGAGAGAAATLVSALIEDVTQTAKELAARSRGSRLDPPLLLALDEIGNLAPLPSLQSLVAEGGGTGITTMPVLQNLNQARDKWSEHAAGAIWSASNVKVILGGEGSARDLADVSALIGDRDEVTDSFTVGDRGSQSNQRSIRRVPVMPTDAVRELPRGTGLIFMHSAPPFVARLRAWTDRPEAQALLAERAEVEAQLEAGDARTFDE